MIVAMVTFDVPKGTTLVAAREQFVKAAPRFKNVPGLIRKYFTFGEGPTAGGCYLWTSMEAAEKMYTPAWHKAVSDTYGSAPRITYYQVPVIVDNEADKTTVPE
jgi:hypothetical protein